MDVLKYGKEIASKRATGTFVIYVKIWLGCMLLFSLAQTAELITTDLPGIGITASLCVLAGITFYRSRFSKNYKLKTLERTLLDLTRIMTDIKKEKDREEQSYQTWLEEARQRFEETKKDEDGGFSVSFLIAHERIFKEASLINLEARARRTSEDKAFTEMAIAIFRI